MKTVSLELAKQLKLAGIEIKTYWYWAVHEKGHVIGLEHQTYPKTIPHAIDYYPSPTTDELLEWLPNYVSLCKAGGGRNGTTAGYIACSNANARENWLGRDHRMSNPIPFEEFQDKTPADALAKLALWVKEQE